VDADMKYLAYIVAGIRNKPGRNLAAAFCFALIAANLFTGQYLIAGEVGSVDQGVNRMGADLLVVPSEYTQLLSGAESDDTMAIVAVLPSIYRFNRDFLSEIGTVQGVAGVSAQLFVRAVNIPELSSSPINVYGIDPKTDFTIQPWLQDPLSDPLGTGEVLIGRDIRGTVRDTISIAGRTYTVVGVLDRTQSEMDHALFLSMDDALVLASAETDVRTGGPLIVSGGVNAGLVRVAPGEDRDVVVSRINRLGSAAGITVIGRHFSLDPISQNLDGLPGILNAISAIVLIAAFPLIALIAAMVAHERRHEIGLLRSMGATRPIVVFLVMAESLSLAALGAVAGIVASLVLLFVLDPIGFLNSALQVSFRIPGAAEIVVLAGMAFLVVISMGTLASVYPAYRSSTMNAFDAIRQGGN